MIFGGLLLLSTAVVGATCFLCVYLCGLLDKATTSIITTSCRWLRSCLFGADNGKTPSVLLATTSIRLLLALVYFYAGLAKLNAYWLLHAQPLAMWLPQHSSFPVLGPLFASKSVAFAFSWAGAAFDLFAPFALFSDRIRPYFYPVLVTFHVLTWILFPIGVFPWVMIACTTVFFTDKWHARLWSGMPGSSWKVPKIEDSSDAAATWSKPQVAMVWFFLGIQMLFPWRTRL